MSFDTATKRHMPLRRNRSLPQSKVIMPSKRYKDSPNLWIILVLLRFYLAFVQTGYIHPDEFHQSVQVMAHDVLDIEGRKPWEYTASHPIRSVTFSAFVSLPYFVIKYILSHIFSCFEMDSLTPQMLLVSPRLLITVLSLLSDYSIYRIASLCYLRPWQCVEVFSSSYIMLVYATRTFSNSAELILLSILLWRVSESMVCGTKVIRTENIFQELFEAAATNKEKAKIFRLKKKLPSYQFADSFVIAVIVTYGVFVRPSFTVYSFVPVAFWLQRGVVTREISFSYFNYRCMSLLPGVIFTSVACILIDSFYYGSLTLLELIHWNVTAASFTVTPVNFLTYNFNNENLKEHGFHPLYFHLAVNLPLLHGILGFIGLWYFSKYIYNLLTLDITKKPKVYSLATMLMFSFIFPVVFLSFIPHQEARFLLPSLPPLVLLHSDKISLFTITKFRFTKHFCFLVWHVWNIICVIVFGFMHQGGVTKTMISLHQYITTKPPDVDLHVFFSHTYSPPTFLLMRKIKSVGVTEEGRAFKAARSVYTYDLAGHYEVHKVYEVMRNKSIINQIPNRKHEHLLCIPGSLSDEFLASKPENTTVKQVIHVGGHLTMESFPNLKINEDEITKKCNKACNLFKKLSQLSLKVFEVNYYNGSIT